MCYTIGLRKSGFVIFTAMLESRNMIIDEFDLWKILRFKKFLTFVWLSIDVAYFKLLN